MTADRPVTTQDKPGRRTQDRLLGVDIARSVALVGMMAVHLLPALDGGPVSEAYQVALGRASALFAVLSGVGLALSTGGAQRFSGARMSRARVAVAVRGLLVLAIGLAVAIAPTPAATILAYYGVLFVVAVPFLGLGSRALGVLAVLAAVVTPWLSLLLRVGGLDEREPANLSFVHLPDLGVAVQTTLVSGYYPVLTWLTYLLAGLAVGRLALGRPQVAFAVATAGAGLAIGASVVSALVVRAAGGVTGLDARLDDARAAGRSFGFRGEDLLRESFFGTTPAPDGIWLWVRAPHSGSVADLVHTTGTALLVLGLALLAAPHLGRAAQALAAPGSMPLTLYSLHVISLGLLPSDLSPGTSLLVLVISVAAALAAAAAVGAPRWRGPLEELVAVTVRAVTQPRGTRPDSTGPDDAGGRGRDGRA